MGLSASPSSRIARLAASQRIPDRRKLRNVGGASESGARAGSFIAYCMLKRIASSLTRPMVMLRISIFSTTPPRPSAVLNEIPTITPSRRQFSARTPRTSPDISEPITTPPCPRRTQQSAMWMFSLARPARQPSSSRPDLMQIASSPTSNRQSRTSTFRDESMSSPSPFCAFQGFRNVQLLTATPSQ